MSLGLADRGPLIVAMTFSLNLAMSNSATRRAEYVVSICKRLDQAKHVPFRPNSITGFAILPGRCHQNVDAWVAAHPGNKAVRGWITVSGDGFSCIDVTAHSVVEGPDGGLFDITPLENEYYRKGMRFIRHIGDDGSFLWG